MPDTSSTRPTGLWLTLAGSLVVIALWLGDRALEEKAGGACLWAFGTLMWLTVVAIAALGVAAYIFVALFFDLPLFKTAGQKKDERASQAVTRINRLTALLTRLGAPEPPADALQRVEDLLKEGGALHERVLLAKKAANRSSFPFPFAPTTLSTDVQEWNQKVLDLADACLSLAEASDVKAYRTGMPITTPDMLSTLVEANIATLFRIRDWVTPRAEPLAPD